MQQIPIKAIYNLNGRSININTERLLVKSYSNDSELTPGTSFTHLNRGGGSVKFTLLFV